MISANELRIGNYLYDSNGAVIIVTAEMILHIDRTISFNPPTPIPLTPEILEKAESLNNNTGFGTMTRGGKKVMWSFNHQKVYLRENGEFKYVMESDKFGQYLSGITLKSLHQLQNLYFALTGTELEINLNP